jgi:arylsulfatase A-like enzyme
MPDQQAQPNILFVFSDQHRWCDLGCYGNDQVYSPNLDAFAGEAVRFSHCVSNCPVCVPVRGSMLTGLQPLRHGAITNDLPMWHSVTSIGDVLSEAGYHTGYVGKWHLAGVPRDQFIPRGEGRYGFAEWKVCECNHDYMHAYYYDEENRRVEIEGYEPITQTDLAMDFVRRNAVPRNAGQPWGLVLSWSPPHDPYRLLPASYLERYEGMDIRLRPNVPERIMHTLTRYLTREQIVENYRGYYAHITALDQQFGRLMRALEESGQAQNTIVVYTSDHGDMLGSQGLTNKQLPYDESIRVPLLARWPGHTRVGVSDELIGLVDLPVSLLGLAGLRFPGPVDGADLQALFTNAPPTEITTAEPRGSAVRSEPRPALGAPHSEETPLTGLTTNGGRGPKAIYIFDLIPCHQAMDRGGTEWRGVRTQRYTLARSAGDEGFALYDNEQDPYQMRNLIADPAMAQLKQELLATLGDFIALHDGVPRESGVLPWEELVRRFGYVEAWNKSQAYFGRPPLA